MRPDDGEVSDDQLEAPGLRGGCRIDARRPIRRAAVLHPDFAFVARLMPGDGGALLATELQKASPKTTPMILDVLPGVDVSYAWESEKPFELFVVNSCVYVSAEGSSVNFPRGSRK